MNVNIVCSFCRMVILFFFFYCRENIVAILHWSLCVSGGLVANPVFHHRSRWRGSGCSREGQRHVVRHQCPDSLVIALV